MINLQAVTPPAHLATVKVGRGSISPTDNISLSLVVADVTWGQTVPPFSRSRDDGEGQNWTLAPPQHTTVSFQKRSEQVLAQKWE